MQDFLMLRAIAVIDGFNFYHPIRHHQRRLKQSLQWLDYPSLLHYYAKRVRDIPAHTIEDVHFFTALAKHRDAKYPGTTDRHITYINALKHSGVHVEMGNFKRHQKPYRLNRCENRVPAESSCQLTLESWEEKETDVRIACKVLELATLYPYDVLYLLSADSDLVPAIESLKRIRPDTKIVLVTPPSKAKFHKLKSLSHAHIGMGVSDIATHQYPTEINLPSGHKLLNPWVQVF
jgi:uncharacterized LabA/DUF88 family protein